MDSVFAPIYSILTPPPPPTLVHFLYGENITFIGGLSPPPLQAKNMVPYANHRKNGNLIKNQDIYYAK